MCALRALLPAVNLEKGSTEEIPRVRSALTGRWAALNSRRAVCSTERPSPSPGAKHAEDASRRLRRALGRPLALVFNI